MRTGPFRHTGLWAGFLSVVVCLAPICARGASTTVLDADRQFQFAEEYFENGEYYRAIGEYDRFLYFFPDAEKTVLAKYKIGLCYLRGGKNEEAIQAFQNLIESHEDSPYAMKSYFAMSEANVGLGRRDRALLILQHVIAIAPDQDVKDEAYYRCGWIYVEEGQGGDARDCFNRISPGNRDRFRFESLMKALEKEGEIKHKNPTTAGILAILPGAGHLYCERPRDALISFIVNGAFIFAAYEAFDSDQNVLGGIITAVALGFYSGNIYSAVSSAHKFNREEQNRYFKYVEDHAKVSLSSAGPGADKTLMVSLQFPF